MERDLAIAELQRVAAALDTRVLSRSTFDKHSDISSATVEATFGTWNEAIEAAGLIKRPPGGLPKSEQRRLERLTATAIQAVHGISDDELLADLLRLAHDLGRRPSGNQITAKGKFSSDVYRKRWGSVSHAYEVALSRMK